MNLTCLCIWIWGFFVYEFEVSLYMSLRFLKWWGLSRFTIQLILNEKPKKSIKDIGGLFSSPWKKKFFDLLGKKRYLDWIEHEVIRKDYLAPRTHFALNCASIGCPRPDRRRTPSSANGSGISWSAATRVARLAAIWDRGLSSEIHLDTKVSRLTSRCALGSPS